MNHSAETANAYHLSKGHITVNPVNVANSTAQTDIGKIATNSSESFMGSVVGASVDNIQKDIGEFLLGEGHPFALIFSPILNTVQELGRKDITWLVKSEIVSGIMADGLLENSAEYIAKIATEKFLGKGLLGTGIPMLVVPVIQGVGQLMEPGPFATKLESMGAIVGGGIVANVGGHFVKKGLGFAGSKIAERIFDFKQVSVDDNICSLQNDLDRYKTLFDGFEQRWTDADKSCVEYQIDREMYLEYRQEYYEKYGDGKLEIMVQHLEEEATSEYAESITFAQDMGEGGSNEYNEFGETVDSLESLKQTNGTVLEEIDHCDEIMDNDYGIGW